MFDKPTAVCVCKYDCALCTPCMNNDLKYVNDSKKAEFEIQPIQCVCTVGNTISIIIRKNLMDFNQFFF